MPRISLHLTLAQASAQATAQATWLRFPPLHPLRSGPGVCICHVPWRSCKPVDISFYGNMHGIPETALHRFMLQLETNVTVLKMRNLACLSCKEVAADIWQVAASCLQSCADAADLRIDLLLQGLPPPPPRPSAPSVAPAPTPAQQTPTAPSLEPSAEQEPEHSSSQEQQQQDAGQEKGASSNQAVPQPAVDQNRPPVKPQRRPAAPSSQVT